MKFFLRKSIVVILCLCFASLLSSCMVTSNLTMSDKNSSSSETGITVSSTFLSILEDFSSFTESGAGIMDNAMLNFADKVNSSEYSEEVKIYTNGEGTGYRITFDYTSLTELLKDLNDGKSNSVFSLKDKSFAFNLSMKNYDELKAVIPFLSDENFEVYGPGYSNGMTEDEYYEMIGFLLGDDSIDALAESYVTLNITVPGKITSVAGAEKTSENTVTYTFPVIDFLLLNNPLAFSVKWR